MARSIGWAASVPASSEGRERSLDSSVSVGQCSTGLVRFLLIECELNGGPGACLALEERATIVLRIASGRSLGGIARRISRPVSTIAWEVAGNGGRGRYRALVAERPARSRACRPKARRLALDRELAREAKRRMRLRRFPQQTASRLRLEHPDGPHCPVSHGNGNQALHRQRHDGMWAEVFFSLLASQALRRRKATNNSGVAMAGIMAIVHIPGRLTEILDRAVPVHWKGDLILNRRENSQIATIAAR